MKQDARKEGVGCNVKGWGRDWPSEDQRRTQEIQRLKLPPDWVPTTTTTTIHADQNNKGENEEDHTQYWEKGQTNKSKEKCDLLANLP